MRHFWQGCQKCIIIRYNDLQLLLQILHSTFSADFLCESFQLSAWLGVYVGLIMFWMNKNTWIWYHSYVSAYKVLLEQANHVFVNVGGHSPEKVIEQESRAREPRKSARARASEKGATKNRERHEHNRREKVIDQQYNLNSRLCLHTDPTHYNS